MLKKEIENRITYLGGVCDFQGKSLSDDLMSISFDRWFLTKNFWNGLQQESYDKIEEKGIIPQSELKVYPRIEVKPFLYTPFTKGTEDYEDNYLFEDSIADEAHVNSIIKGDIHKGFIVVGYSDAERWIVCSADENPVNPTVYRVDMDMPFSESCLSVDGTLEEYFNGLLSVDEYQKAVKEHIEKYCSK